MCNKGNANTTKHFWCSVSNYYNRQTYQTHHANNGLKPLLVGRLQTLFSFLLDDFSAFIDRFFKNKQNNRIRMVTSLLISG